MPSTPAEPRRASHRERHGRCGRTRQSRNWPFVETALIAFISISSTVSVDRERRSFVISTRQEMRLQEVRDPLGSVKHRHVSFSMPSESAEYDHVPGLGLFRCGQFPKPGPLETGSVVFRVPGTLQHDPPSLNCLSGVLSTLPRRSRLLLCPAANVTCSHLDIVFGQTRRMNRPRRHTAANAERK